MFEFHLLLSEIQYLILFFLLFFLLSIQYSSTFQINAYCLKVYYSALCIWLHKITDRFEVRKTTPLSCLLDQQHLNLIFSLCIFVSLIYFLYFLFGLVRFHLKNSKSKKTHSFWNVICIWEKFTIFNIKRQRNDDRIPKLKKVMH